MDENLRKAMYGYAEPEEMQESDMEQIQTIIRSGIKSKTLEIGGKKIQIVNPEYIDMLEAKLIETARELKKLERKLIQTNNQANAQLHNLQTSIDRLDAELRKKINARY